MSDKRRDYNDTTEIVRHPSPHNPPPQTSPLPTPHLILGGGQFDGVNGKQKQKKSENIIKRPTKHWRGGELDEGGADEGERRPLQLGLRATKTPLLCLRKKTIEKQTGSGSLSTPRGNRAEQKKLLTDVMGESHLWSLSCRRHSPLVEIALQVAQIVVRSKDIKKLMVL